jgi:PAS domain S-box-containing protein
MRKQLSFILLFLAVLFLPNSILLGQYNHQEDSLLELLEGEIHDTSKTDLLIKIASEFSYSDKEKAAEYMKQAIDISKQLKSPIEKIIALNKIGNYLIYQHEYKLAIEIYEQSLNLYDKIGNHEQVSFVYGNLGRLYKNIGIYSKSLEYYNKALEIDIAINNQNGIAYGYGGIGNIYKKISNFEKALEYYQKALALNEELDIPLGVAYTCNGIGSIFSELGNYEKAISYYQRALDINKELKNKRGVIYSMASIGDIYKKINNIEKAIEYNENALELSYEISALSSTAHALSNLGYIYKEAKNFEKALGYFHKSLDINEQNNLLKPTSLILSEIGLLYAEIGNLKEAIIYCEKGLKIANDIRALNEISLAYEHLSYTYRKIGDYKKAYQYHILFSQVNDSIYSNTSAEKIAEMQTRFETDKKEKENKILKQEQIINDIKIRKQYIISITISLVLIIVLIFVVMLLRTNALRKKANKLLRKQKAEINSQAEMLENANKELKNLSIVASETTNAIMIMDPEGEIEWINEGFIRIYGYNLIELKEKFGNNIKEACSNEDIRKLLKEWIGKKKSIQYESFNHTKSGERIYAQTTITPVLNAEQEIIKLVSIDSDITALIKADEEIRRKNADITDSIAYAKRIQDAIMPSFEGLKKIVDDCFLIYIPKDIVSGDFLWFSTINGKLIIATADCTGHGVPGAFMSLIGISFLNKIVNEKGITDPAKILDQLKMNVMNSLHKSGKQGETTDGMDISIVVIDKKKKIVEYASAMNPIYLIRENNLTEYVADKMPIGMYELINKSYTKYSFDYLKGDQLYLFSDGYVDQYGGKKNRKFKYHNFKKLLVDNSDRFMSAQKEALVFNFEEWKGDQEQIDDIIILGIQL